MFFKNAALTVWNSFSDKTASDSTSTDHCARL